MERDINDQTGQREPPAKLVLHILVRPNRNGPFYDVTTRIFGIWVEWKAPKISSFAGAKVRRQEPPGLATCRAQPQKAWKKK